MIRFQADDDLILFLSTNNTMLTPRLQIEQDKELISFTTNRVFSVGSCRFGGLHLPNMQGPTKMALLGWQVHNMNLNGKARAATFLEELSRYNGKNVMSTGNPRNTFCRDIQSFAEVRFLIVTVISFRACPCMLPMVESFRHI